MMQKNKRNKFKEEVLEIEVETNSEDEIEDNSLISEEKPQVEILKEDKPKVMPKINIRLIN